LETIEVQESASWNMGPTLLSWLEAHDSATYKRLQQADRDSMARFSGHGSALAQSYNHIIMPLANERDKQTQIRWGIADFQARFNRMPEGMWLAETAVDTDTLEALVDNGIRFTVLAPRQCKAVKFQDSEDWHEVHGNVDSRRAYRCPLPSGRSIDLFYYDGNVSKAVAFEGLLNDGRLLADKLMNALDHHPDEPQISQIATDGESYGHHHKKGEMALAFCLNHIDKNGDFELTNYGEFLELYPPVWETQIHDNSSWSCVHGVERWRSDCGCHTGGEAGWNQSWRQPLRTALDGVRERLITAFEREAGKLFQDPWAARDGYIELVLDRSAADQFVERHAKGEITPETKVRMLRLLEMQRHCMLMYTSCAWFFNEVTGIETLQVLQYANRALHLCEVITGEDFHPDFLHSLENVPSNVRENAAVAYRENVMPARVGLLRVGMHFAAASLFEERMDELELFNYRAEIHDLQPLRAGGYRLSLGRMTIVSNLTYSSKTFCFGVLYLGQQTMIGSIRSDMHEADYETAAAALAEEFRAGRTLELAAQNFSDVYYDNYQLMSTMRANGMPLPDAYTAAIRFTLHRRFTELLTDGEGGLLDLPRLDRLIADYQHWAHNWEKTDDLCQEAEVLLHKIVLASFTDAENWKLADHFLQSVEHLELTPNFHRAQNAFLEGWTPDYVYALSDVSLAAGLAVARDLNFELGFVAEETGA